MQLISENLFTEKNKLYTLSDNKKSIYGEKIIIKNNKFYREWNPFRSKIAAALMRKLNKLNITENSKILYLGCASGTTVSHISDIAKKGLIFAVDISQKEMSLLYLKLKNRNNVAPILADANLPQTYLKNMNYLKVDVIIQDLATPKQLDILFKNSDLYLKNGGEIYFSIKIKSITQFKKQTDVLEEIKLKLNKKYKLLKSVNLRKYEDNHWLIHLKKDF
ncbi:MAG: fibrillarin-like rRNA/tRNA 2'-O-methyltransferase [Candidatus Woesearchaeota archaeon]